MFKRLFIFISTILLLFGCSLPTDNEQTHTSKPLNKDSAGLTVHYIDVGQGDATLLQYGNHTILYDTGDWKRHETTAYLKSQDIKDLDLIVVTHPDADHIGQLKEIMETFNVGEIWMSGNTNTSHIFQDALDAVLNSNADYYEPRAGEHFEIGDMQLDVVHPESINGKANEESISTLFTYGDIKFLFTGDADKKAEREMMKQTKTIKADILQLGHHGSNTSSDPQFLDAVNPSVAIYSAGKDNTYGHPHKEVIERLQQRNIKTYGTDTSGTIIVKTDGKTYKIETIEQGLVPSKDTSSTKLEKSIEKKPIASKKQANSSQTCIDINQASKEDLQNIKHIGPARAKELIQLRPYQSIDELFEVNGISENQLQEIKEQNIACTK